MNSVMYYTPSALKSQSFSRFFLSFFRLKNGYAKGRPPLSRSVPLLYGAAIGAHRKLSLIGKFSSAVFAFRGVTFFLGALSLR